jgi:hypothetical protein
VLDRERSDVYVIRCRETGRLKVGISEDIPRRLHSLRHSSPTELVLELWVEHGGFGLEQRIHGVLHAYRLKGEWFRSDPMVLFLIKQAISDASINAPGAFTVHIPSQKKASRAPSRRAGEGP